MYSRMFMQYETVSWHWPLRDKGLSRQIGTGSPGDLIIRGDLSLGRIGWLNWDEVHLGDSWIFSDAYGWLQLEAGRALSWPRESLNIQSPPSVSLGTFICWVLDNACSGHFGQVCQFWTIFEVEGGRTFQNVMTKRESEHTVRIWCHHLLSCKFLRFLSFSTKFELFCAIFLIVRRQGLIERAHS